MDVKVGDVVHVRGTVCQSLDEDGDVGIKFVDDWHYVKPADIFYIESRPLRVGDRVTAGVYLGTIRAIHNNEVWVDRDLCGCATFTFDQLRRV